MSDSIRQQIVDAIKTRLGTIAPGTTFTLPSGVYTCTSQLHTAPDGSPGVYSWQKVPFSRNQVPAIAFWDTDADVKAGPSTKHEHSLPIGIAGFVAGGTPKATARAMMADIVAAIGSDPRWGNLARWTDIEKQSVDVDQAGDVIAAVQILCTVTYRTPLWRM